MGKPKPIFALEIGPLAELQYTGIPKVNQMLALQMLEDDAVEARFFRNRQDIPRAVVERICAAGSGAMLKWFGGRTDFKHRWPTDAKTPIIGVYPNDKTPERLFPFEARIVHDLTPLLAPQFHNSDNIEFFNRVTLRDVLCSDLIVAVSESTRDDILRYFPGVKGRDVLVAHLAASASSADDTPTYSNIEPYIVILGTLEPRKNIGFVLEYLSANPQLLENYRFVFLGRLGWGEEPAAAVASEGLRSAMRKGRIMFTGFVSETSKEMLVKHAHCLIYGSRYEGFGLPIVEALAQGVGVVAGVGSSLVEAGGDVANYFDPTSQSSFETALLKCLRERSDEHVAARRRWAMRFSWKRFYESIRDESLKLAEQKLAHNVV